jgi:hypothetical protein
MQSIQYLLQLITAGVTYVGIKCTEGSYLINLAQKIPDIRGYP